MTDRSRFDVWLQRVAFGWFAASMGAERWWLRRNQRHDMSPGPVDDDRSRVLPDGLSNGLSDGLSDGRIAGGSIVDPEPSDTTTHPSALIPVGYERSDTLASLSMLVGMLVMSQLVWGPFNRRTDDFMFRHRIANVGLSGANRRGPARWLHRSAVWVTAMVAWDFLYYWEHRWMHEVRLLWAHHVSHHSSERYNLSTALRQPWSNILTHWVFTPMALAGFPPAMVERVGGFNLLYQFWIHTEAIDRLPPAAERVLNTASHHRVHHGVEPEYLDKNYGGILIVWDKLFGTFEPERRRVTYGLTKNIHSYNPLVIAYHEFVALARDVRADRTWGHRFRHIFGRPGWTPVREPQGDVLNGA